MNPQDVTLFFDGFAERFAAERAALIATGFLRGSKALDGVTEIDLLAATAFWRAFADGVAQRGKAQLGDKTVLDVLDLIATALENAAGQPLPEALRRADLQHRLGAVDPVHEALRLAPVAPGPVQAADAEFAFPVVHVSTSMSER